MSEERRLCCACRAAEEDARDPFGPFHQLDEPHLDESTAAWWMRVARDFSESAIRALNNCDAERALERLRTAGAALVKLDRAKQQGAA